MRNATLALLFMLFGPAAHAEPLALLEGLSGNWRGAGSFQGSPSQVSAAFSPLFDGAAWALDIDVRFARDGAPPQAFAGRAAYVVRDGALADGVWVDSTANAYKLTPHVEEGTLIVEWGDANLAGQSTYRLVANDSLQIVDFVRTSSGEYRRFADAMLQRAD